MLETWEIVGTITVEGDKLRLPSLPASPGLYRLTFDDDALYIGEANDISRRVGDYEVYYPSVGIESEYRINQRLLRSKRGTQVAVLQSITFEDHSSRCIREHQEIRSARANGKTVLNGGNLEERIAFHEREITRLRVKLEVQNQLRGGNHE